MAVYLAIDNRLLKEAVQLGGRLTQEATVHAALFDYVQRRKQRKILDLIGTIDFDPTYNYKAQRSKR